MGACCAAPLRGVRVPSSAAFGNVGDGYVAEVHRWATANGISVRRFAKGENKEEIARPLIEAAERGGGDGKVVLIGIAQEKTPVWRSWKAEGQERASHPDLFSRGIRVRGQLLLIIDDVNGGLLGGGCSSVDTDVISH